MLNQILDRGNLNLAYLQVYRNKGAGGVDGLGVEDLKTQLQVHGRRYVNAIRKGCYAVHPIKGVEIPKGNGKVRLLGIPTVTDRVFQQAVLQVLQPLFEKDFQKHSYGFRPNRNAHQAVRQSLQNINDQYQDIVDIDLKSFFDEVDHSLLLELLHSKVKCPLTMKLIRSFLRAPIRIKGSLHKRRKGMPQGSPLSPLLSNILLNELDKELERRGHRYVRYADDFSIYVRSKEAAKRVSRSIRNFLRDKLRLPINVEKSGIRRPASFKVLGYGFVPTYKKGEKGKYQLVVDKSKWKTFQQKLKQLTRKTTPMSFDERMGKLKLACRGWLNYFKMASMHAKLKKLDEWLRNRIRYCIWHHWKRPERKRKNLKRLGVPDQQAYAWSRTRMGGWATAQSPILRTTITVERLTRRGLIGLTEYYHKIKAG